MYESFFGFSERPFSIAPDPRFLYLSERHREALAHLVYGLHDDGGFVMLTGEVGTGKTTLCRSLLAQVPEHIDVAFVLNPRLDAVELLETVCDELHIDCSTARGSVKQLVDRINAHLLARNAENRSTVLLIDEAQNLSTDVLEQLRLLTNLETNERKLLRIILIGQPELADKLARDDLRQLAQRITARYHLESLGPDDTAAYVEHRLQVAGARTALFSAAALRTLHRASSGVPRLINTIADRALLGAYGSGKREVGPEMVRKAASEVTGQPRPRKPRPWWQFGLAASAVFALGAAGAWAVLRLPAQESRALAGMASSADAAVAGSEKTKRGGDGGSASEPVQGAGEDPLLAPSAADASPPTPVPSATIADPNLVVRADLPPWPDYLPIDESNERAFDAVFRRWKAPFQPSPVESPCDYARQVGMACMRGRTTLAALAEINRPAVLELQDPERGTYFAALTRLDDAHANLVIAERTYRVPRTALASRWAGDYTLLWQLPPDYRGPIGVGARGAAVAWLREQLERATGTAVAGTVFDRFDATLGETLKRWQRDVGLDADGRAGPRTWIALHDAAGMEAPRLATANASRAAVVQRDEPAQRPSAPASRRAPSPPSAPSAPSRIDVEAAEELDEGYIVIGPSTESAG